MASKGGTNVIAQATVAVIPSMKGSRVSIRKDLGNLLGSEAENAGRSSGAKIGSGLGEGLSTMKMAIGNALGNLFTSAASTAAGAVKNVLSTAFSEYSSFQQLEGGVETLFKNSADTVKNYAKDAFKEAGMSANDYMDTVTSFSASLISSLGGDTKAAADLGNQAVIDMSDNANKMGSDIGMIQATYQSLARGNFGMLDNLKLGFGGTKEEAQRLLDKAKELSAAQGDYRDFSIDSFGDIVEAIHLVQTEMGITGTTQKEAATTIEGSLNQLKASWTNFLSGIANPDADMDKLTSQLADSVKISLNNVVPAAEQMVKTVSGLAIKGLESMGFKNVREGIDSVKAKFQEWAPVIQSRVMPVLEKLGDFLRNIIQTVGDALPGVLDMIAGAADALWQYAGPAEEAFGELGGMIQDVAKYLSQFIEPASQAFEALAGSAGEFVGEIIEMGKGILQTAKDSGAAEQAAQTIKDILSWITENSDTVIHVVAALGGLKIAKMAGGFAQMAGGLGKLGLENVVGKAGAAKNAITGFGSGVKSAYKSITGFPSTLSLMKDSLSALAKEKGVVAGFKEFVGIGGKSPGVFSKAAASVKAFGANALAAGRNALTAAKGGIAAMATGFKNLFKGGIIAKLKMLPGLISGALGPVGIAITVIAAITAGIAAFLTQTEEGQKILGQFQEFMGGVWERIQEIFAKFGTSAEEVGGQIKDGFCVFLENAFLILEQVITAVIDAVVAAIDFFQNDPLGQQIVSTIQGVAAFIGSTLEFVFGLFQTIFGAIYGVATGDFSMMDEGIQAIMSGLSGALGTIWQGIAKTAEGIWTGLMNTLTGIGKGITNAVVGALESAKQQLTNIGINIGQGLASIFHNLQQTLGNIWDGIKTTAINAWNNITGRVSEVAGQIGGFLSSIPGTVAGIFEDLKNRAVERIQGIVDGFMQLPGQVADVGWNLVSGIWQGINDAAGWIKGMISGWVGDVTGFLKGLLGIHSPSRVMRDEVGKQIVAGIGLGITQNTNTVRNAFKVLANTAKKSAKAADIGKAAQNMAKTFTNAISASLKAAEKKTSNAWTAYYDKQVAANTKARDKLKARIAKATEKYNKSIKALEDRYNARIARTNDKTRKSNLKAELKARKDELKARLTSTKEILNKQIADLKTQKETLTKNYKQFAKDVLKKFNTAMENATTKVSDALSTKLEDLADNAQKRLDNVNSKIESFQSRLYDGSGELFKTGSVSGKVYLQDLDKQTRAINAFGANLERLKKKNLNSNLLEEIAGMDLEEGSKFSEKLLSLSGKELAAYNRAYTARLNASKSVSQRFYSNQVAAIRKDYADKVAAALNSARKQIETIGKQTMNGFIAGMKNTKWKSEISSIANGIIKAFKDKLKIKSPSRVFRELGAYSGEGYTLGLADEMRDVASIMDKYTTATKSITPPVAGPQVPATAAPLLSSPMTPAAGLIAGGNTGGDTWNVNVDGSAILASPMLLNKFLEFMTLLKQETTAYA